MRVMGKGVMRRGVRVVRSRVTYVSVLRREEQNESINVYTNGRIWESFWYSIGVELWSTLDQTTSTSGLT